MAYTGLYEDVSVVSEDGCVGEERLDKIGEGEGGEQVESHAEMIELYRPPSWRSNTEGMWEIGS